FHILHARRLARRDRCTAARRGAGRGRRDGGDPGSSGNGFPRPPRHPLAASRIAVPARLTLARTPGPAARRPRSEHSASLPRATASAGVAERSRAGCDSRPPSVARRRIRLSLVFGIREGRMILRAAMAVVPVAVASLVPLPAHADVLEIGAGGESSWIAGPLVQSGDRGPSAGLEISPETALVADWATAEPAQAARIVPQAYAAKVAELSARFDLSPALIEALVWQESRWRAQALSPKGARGLAQLMPGTARELG